MALLSGVMSVEEKVLKEFIEKGLLFRTNMLIFHTIKENQYMISEN